MIYYADLDLEVAAKINCSLGAHSCEGARVMEFLAGSSLGRGILPAEYLERPPASRSSLN
jgi:hypothetical protein